MKRQILFFRKNLILHANCMKCQILFSRKNKKNIIRMPSADLVLSTVSVKISVMRQNLNKINTKILK